MTFQQSRRNKTKEEEELAPEQNEIGQKQQRAKRSNQKPLNVKNNGNDKKASQKDKREKKKHIKLRQRIKMERILLRHKNRLSCKDPKTMTKMISLGMNCC